MKAVARQVGRAVLSSRPVLSALRARLRLSDPVTVLCYHTIGPDTGGPDAWTVLRAGDFCAQLSIMRDHHDIVSLDDALAVGPGRKGQRPKLVLTFDDGEAGLYDHLLPILDAEKVPVTIYVATGQIEAGRPYWFDRIMGALQGACTVDLSREGLGLRTLPADPGRARWAVLSDLLETLKRVDPSRREDMTDRIVASQPPRDGRPRPGPLTRDELAAVARSPWVTIGAHSHCHNLLDQIPASEAEQSMALSRDLLRSWTGHDIAHFAWPNGNETPALRRTAERLGFRSAAALDDRLWHPGADRFALPRLGIGRYDDAARFRLRLVGI